MEKSTATHTTVKSHMTTATPTVRSYFLVSIIGTWLLFPGDVLSVEPVEAFC